MILESRPFVIKAFEEDFDSDMAFTTQYDQAVTSIVSRYAMHKADPFLDRKRATDFVCKTVYIASRVRRARYEGKFPFQFTIRNERSSGTKTEFEKILEGFADWMFYGYAIEDGSFGISSWMIINLDILRRELRAHAPCRWDIISNRDGETNFRAFDARSFEAADELIIASNPVVKYDPSVGFGRM